MKEDGGEVYEQDSPWRRVKRSGQAGGEECADRQGGGLVRWRGGEYCVKYSVVEVRKEIKSREREQMKGVKI